MEGGGVGKKREDSGCSHAVEERSAPQVTEFPIQRSAPSLMNTESVQWVDWKSVKLSAERWVCM